MYVFKILRSWQCFKQRYHVPQGKVQFYVEVGASLLSQNKFVRTIRFLNLYCYLNLFQQSHLRNMILENFTLSLEHDFVLAPGIPRFVIQCIYIVNRQTLHRVIFYIIHVLIYMYMCNTCTSLCISIFHQEKGSYSFSYYSVHHVNLFLKLHAVPRAFILLNIEYYWTNWYNKKLNSVFDLGPWQFA